MEDFLFAQQGELSAWLLELEELADELVAEMSEPDLLEESVESHVKTLLGTLMPQTPELLLDRVTRSEHVASDQPSLEFRVPFGGTRAIFFYKPSRCSEAPPRGRLETVLVLSISTTGPDIQALEEAFLETVGIIEKWLGAVSDDLASFQVRLSARLEAALARRRSALIHELALDMAFFEAETARPSIPDLTVDEVRSMRERGESFRLLDGRGEKAWREGHLPGAEWIEYRKLAREAKWRFAPDEHIVVYCKGFG